MEEIERVREYWDRRPCNILHGTAPVGSIEWSEQVTARKYFVESHLPGFAQFERWRGKDVLEIGCGIASDTVQFAKAGARVFAVDLSGNSVKIARKRLLPFGEATCVSVRNAEEELPDWDFDLIYSYGALHHTPHPERALRLAHTRLKSDGELRIMLYAKWSIKYFTCGQPEAQAGCPIARFYSAREAKKLLKSCGFRVESIQKAHIFPWRLKDYIQYRYVKAFPWNITPTWLFRWLESKLGHHLLLVAKKRGA